MPEEFEDWVMCKLKETAKNTVGLMIIAAVVGFVAYTISREPPFGKDIIITFVAIGLVYMVGLIHGLVIADYSVKRRKKEFQNVAS